MRVLCLSISCLLGLVVFPAFPVAAGTFPVRVTKGKVAVTVTASPSEVDFSRNVKLSVKAEFPSHVKLAIPDLDQYVRGFEIIGCYDISERPSRGNHVLEKRALLKPVVSAEYRLLALPVIYTAAEEGRSVAGWLAVPPCSFTLAEGFEKAGGERRRIPEPLSMDDPPYTKFLKVSAVLLAAVLICLLLRAVKKTRFSRNQPESPAERALSGIDALVSGMPRTETGVRNFHSGLSALLREYIEQACGIKAGEMTTDELSRAAGPNTAAGNLIGNLKPLLAEADLAKFSTEHVSRESAEKAARTASEIIRRHAAVVESK
ncbi:MAG: hypothetical protein R6V03_10800 [Kiritimatiellia bacterium]